MLVRGAPTARAPGGAIVFDGSMLDVAIGLLLVFLVASLMASAVVEAIGGFLHRRQKHLWDTLDLLLGNTSPAAGGVAGGAGSSIVNQLYQQPFITGLVRPTDRQFFKPDEHVTVDERVPLRSKSTVKTRATGAAELRRRHYGPTYIESREFANALLRYVRTTAADPSATASPTVSPPTDVDYAALVAGLPADLRVKLADIVAEAGGQFERVREGVEHWFDRNMAAASEWYRRQTRWFLFIAGLCLAIGMNIDAVHAATTLYRDDQTRAAVVSVAEQVGSATCGARDLACVRDTVGGSIGLPVGWSHIDGSAGAWSLRLLGWLIVAGSVTLGAPFWFDLLRRALAVRRKASSA